MEDRPGNYLIILTPNSVEGDKVKQQCLTLKGSVLSHHLFTNIQLRIGIMHVCESYTRLHPHEVVGKVISQLGYELLEGAETD